MFIGDNEGWPMGRAGARSSCSARWAAIYAQRARIMANTYRRNAPRASTG
jgi:hypothetical protein